MDLCRVADSHTTFVRRYLRVLTFCNTLEAANILERLVPGPSLRVLMWSAAVLAATVACSSASAPRGPGRLVVVAGGGQSDSVASNLPQALDIRIEAGPGQTKSNQIVQFRSVLNADGTSNVYVWPINSFSPTTFVVDTTGSAGEVGVHVQLGTVAGVARLIVAVPVLGLADTVSFTVLPGGTARISAGPRDTAIYVNATENLRATTADQFGNPRSGDTIRYTIASGPATTSGSVLTGSGVGRVKIVASIGKAADTMFTSIVPQGTLAAVSFDTAIVMFNLDGSGFVTLVQGDATTAK